MLQYIISIMQHTVIFPGQISFPLGVPITHHTFTQHWYTAKREFSIAQLPCFNMPSTVISGIKLDYPFSVVMNLHFVCFNRTVCHYEMSTHQVPGIWSSNHSPRWLLSPLRWNPPSPALKAENQNSIHQWSESQHNRAKHSFNHIHKQKWSRLPDIGQSQAPQILSPCVLRCQQAGEPSLCNCLQNASLSYRTQSPLLCLGGAFPEHLNSR